MALINLTTQTITRNGINDPSGSAVGGADTADFVNDGATWLRVVWGGTGGLLTIVTPVNVLSSPALAIEDQVLAFSPSLVKFIGPFPPAFFNDPATGKVTVDPDQSCTITAFKLGSGT